MAEDCLEIEYSPILKEKIRIIKNGGDVLSSNSDTGAWQGVFNELKTKDGKYKFLQEVGEDFFDCLYKACHGSVLGNTVNINMKTTKEVYEEFKTMTEWYNSKSDDKKIVLQKLMELLPNEEVCEQILKKTQDTKKCLENERNDFQNYDKDVKNLIEEGITDLQHALETVAEDNTISICVTGVYSSGKSAFINALIGEEILESDDDPSTAAFFSVTKIKKTEPVKVKFAVSSPKSETISLKFTDNHFQPEHEIKNEIIKNELLPQLSSEKPCVEQIHTITKFINNKIKKYSDVTTSSNDEESEEQQEKYQDLQIESEEVDILYPFELGDNIPVKICDTPGTNSSYKNDSEVIESALKNQRNSILITIIAPDKSQDRAGNNLLFKALENSEKKNIFLDRSRLLFVWNKIDSNSRCKDEKINGKKNTDGTFEGGWKNEKLEIEGETGKIKTIRLKDYPLFFISSWRALSSVKLLEEPDNEHFKEMYEDSKVLINLSKECSLGWQTDEIHKKTECALENAGNDEYKQALILSGLYAVKESITDYINKYSTAIVANGMYTTVSTIAEELASEARKFKCMQEQAKNQSYTAFKNKEEELKKAVGDSCKKEQKAYNNSGSTERLKEFDDDILNRVKSLRHEKIHGKSIDRYHLRKTNKHILEGLSQRLKEYVNDKIEKQNIFLRIKTEAAYNHITEDLQTSFEEVMDTDSWENIKNKVLKDISKREKNIRFGSIHDSQRFWLHKIDVTNFEKEVSRVINTETASVRQSIIEFPKTMEGILKEIKDSYLNHLEDYSTTLTKLRENAESANEKFEYLEKLSNLLGDKQKALEDAIFKTKL